MTSLPNGSQSSSIIFLQKYVTVSETVLFKSEYRVRRVLRMSGRTGYQVNLKYYKDVNYN